MKACTSKLVPFQQSSASAANVPLGRMSFQICSTAGPDVLHWNHP
jgi:hypothetical protein